MSAITASAGFITWLPNIIEILTIGVVLSLAMTYAYKFLTDQAVMKELKEELNKLKVKMKQHRKDPDKMQEIQKKMMPINMKYFKLSMKPTLITLLPFLLIFIGLNSVYGETPIIGPWSFSLPLIGNSLEWIGTYIIASLILTTLFRKLLKVV